MKLWSSVTRLCLAAFSVSAICAVLGGCSSTPFPAVLTDPPPPTDTTLSPDQVKRAMDNLIADRNHLCAEATADAAPGSPPPDCSTATTTGTTPNSGAAAKP
jgi:hypothetical protein